MLSTHLARHLSGPQATTSLLTDLLLPSAVLQLCLVPTLRSTGERLPGAFFIPTALWKLWRSSWAARILSNQCFGHSQLESSNNNNVLPDSVAGPQQRPLHAQEAESKSGTMLPFRNHGNQGFFHQAAPPQWMQMNMNMMNQRQMFMHQQQNMYVQPPQITLTPGLYSDAQVYFKGNRSRGPMGHRGGNQFGPRLNQTQPLFPQDNDRHRPKLK